MKLTHVILITIVLFAAGESRCAERVDFQTQIQPILQQRCIKCHGKKKQSGELRLDTLASDFASDRRAAERWHDVRDALQLGEMPPKDAPQLSPEQRQLIVKWIAEQTKSLAKERSSGTVLRRLNRTEYQNTMRDLLGIDTPFAENLPPDSSSEDGFRNNGAALRMSDLQLEYYLQAARDALARVIVSGDEPPVFRQPFIKSVTDKNRGSNMLDDDQQFVAKLLEYPSEGEFLIRVKARAKFVDGRGYPQLRAAVGFRADVQAPRAHMKAIDVDSEEWQTYEFRDRIEHFPLPTKAQSKFPGLLIWLDNVYGEGRNKPLKPRKVKKKKRSKKGEPEEQPEPPVVKADYPLIEIESLEFVGPVFESWPPKHHTEILFAKLAPDQDEASYVAAVLKRFMSRAFRRSVSESETDLYLRFFALARKSGQSFEHAIRESLALVLISPDFLYLVERTGSKAARISDVELASRLSYFLWSTMPDDRLLELAMKNELSSPATIRETVKRMIADPRSKQFVEQFTEQWLDLGAVDRVAVNPEFYPDFDNELKSSMRDESVQFFAEILYYDLSSLNFLDCDFAVLNETLAKHYGLTGPLGSAFQRVELAESSPRGGVLAHASVLLGNSTGEDSHPVKRAVWIRDRLLNDPPADPPPNVPNLDATNPKFASLSVREQLELHREDAACNDCHRGIDPWGIALENFGADGLWRDEILRKKSTGKGLTGEEVESHTSLPDGHIIDGFSDLKDYLIKHRRDQFAKAFTSKLLTYALGRSLEVTDDALVDELTAKFADSDYKIASLIQFVVASEAFQSK